MLIGVPKEIKTEENRVGLTPGAVRELVQRGHSIIVETNAAHSIGIDDADFEAAGAVIAGGADEVFAQADMIVKVKEPQPAEFDLLRLLVGVVPEHHLWLQRTELSIANADGAVPRSSIIRRIEVSC